MEPTYYRIERSERECPGCSACAGEGRLGACWFKCNGTGILTTAEAVEVKRCNNQICHSGIADEVYADGSVIPTTCTTCGGSSWIGGPAEFNVDELPDGTFSFAAHKDDRAMELGGYATHEDAVAAAIRVLA